MGVIDQLREVVECLECGLLTLQYDAAYEGWVVHISSCKWETPFRYPVDSDDSIPDLYETCREALAAFINWMPTYVTPSGSSPPRT